MINLLPDSERRRISREYAARFLAAALSFSAGAFVLGIVFLAPAYLSARAAYEGAATRHAALDSAALKKQAETALSAKDIERKLKLLKAAPTPAAVATIEKVVLRRVAGVSVTNLSYERRSSGTKLDVTGTAENREALITFVDALKAEPAFAEVYSPVSNLVKDRDIGFTISIALAP